jgi:hypothetical protein
MRLLGENYRVSFAEVRPELGQIHDIDLQR